MKDKSLESLIERVEQTMDKADEVNIGLLPKEDIHLLIDYNQAVNQLMKHLKEFVS